MNSPRIMTTATNKPNTRTLRAVALCAGALIPALALAGCSSGLGGGGASGGSAGAFTITGNVHGGQQPVSGSTIQLYTVGTTGLKSASTALIASTVTTAADGSFTITGKYNCSSATQVYITATGGNPGTGSNNSAIAMTAALGYCTLLNANTFVWINEVTTVAAAYGLAPFAADITHIGASGSNPTGLVNAFGNAGLLANPTTGTPGGTGLGSGVTVPINEINTLANILAACVNASGPSSSSCTTLFSATGATETFGAILAVAKNPGAAAITALYNVPLPTPPFAPALSAQPSDFSVAVSIAPPGQLATPYAIAIDAQGDAWVANESSNSVGIFGPNGNVSASAPIPGLYGAQGIAIDRAGNVLIANTGGNSIVKLGTAGPSIATTITVPVPAGAAPVALAVDSANNVFIADLNGNSVYGISSSGTPLSGAPFTGGSRITVPTAIAVGPTGLVYVTSGSGSVITLTNAGAYSASLNDGTLQGPAGIAVDTTGRLAVSGFTTGSAVGGALAEFASGAAVTGSPFTSASSSPAGVATDGTSVWVANNTTSGGLAQYAYGTASPVSPGTGFGSLNAPTSVAVDGSGSVWTTNSGSNSISKFIGIAAPVTTPLAANVGP